MVVRVSMGIFVPEIPVLSRRYCFRKWTSSQDGSAQRNSHKWRLHNLASRRTPWIQWTLTLVCHHQSSTVAHPENSDIERAHPTEKKSRRLSSTNQSPWCRTCSVYPRHQTVLGMHRSVLRMCLSTIFRQVKQISLWSISSRIYPQQTDALYYSGSLHQSKKYPSAKESWSPENIPEFVKIQITI